MKKSLTIVHCFVVALCLLLGFAGCGTMSKTGGDGRGDVSSIMIHQIVIIADTSISMSVDKKKIQETDFLNLFIRSMPEGEYGAGFMVFNDKVKVLNAVSPFNRSGLLGNVGQLVDMSGDTMMELAIQELQTELAEFGGTTAVLLVSDGIDVDETAVMRAGAELLESYEGRLCFHTVHIGTDEAGYALLRRVSQWTDCGSYRSINQLPTSDAVGEFVLEIFTGIRPAKPPVEEKEEVKAPDDSDGDGVPDSKDECPNTPKGAKVDNRGCWVLDDLHFEYDKHTIKPVYYPLLDQVAEVLEKNEDVKIQIDGHTDAIASEQYNQQLSEKRANAVREYLISKGIDESRLRTKGYGESKPIRPNDSEENRALNRRVELTVMNE